MSKQLYIVLYMAIVLIVASCKEEEVLKQERPPDPSVVFTFTNEAGNSTRSSAPNFTIANPGVNGSFTFNTRIESKAGKIIDSIFIEYQYSILTTGGGGSSYGWSGWDTIRVATPVATYDLNYTFQIADINEFYIGAEWVGSGLNGKTQIARDENETRLTVKFTDGTTARSPKLTWTYAVSASGKE
jgi:hypothetical protein